MASSFFYALLAAVFLFGIFASLDAAKSLESVDLGDENSAADKEARVKFLMDSINDMFRQMANFTNAIGNRKANSAGRNGRRSRLHFLRRKRRQAKIGTDTPNNNAKGDGENGRRPDMEVVSMSSYRSVNEMLMPVRHRNDAPNELVKKKLEEFKQMYEECIGMLEKSKLKEMMEKNGATKEEIRDSFLLTLSMALENNGFCARTITLLEEALEAAWALNDIKTLLAIVKQEETKNILVLVKLKEMMNNVEDGQRMLPMNKRGGGIQEG